MENPPLTYQDLLDKVQQYEDNKIILKYNKTFKGVG
jgi:hypothetical protein